MNKIKAKTERNEIAWIFFSLLARNAMQIAKRMQATSHAKGAVQLKIAA